MSDTGLQGSIYEQLRSYADNLDRALIELRNSHTHIAEQARQQIVALLRELTNRDTNDPAALLVTAILKQGLPSVAGQGLALCDTLATTLANRAPSPSELNQLEQLALTLDKECSSTLARIKGR